MAKRVGLVQAVRLARANATLGDLWDRLATVYGRRIAFSLESPLELHVLTARELTYEDIAEVVARLAGGLVALGVKRGDRVAVCTENRIDYALTIFAAARAGAIAVPLHHHLKPAEAASLAKQSRAKVLVADPALAAGVKATKARGFRLVTAGKGGALDRASAAAGRLEAVATSPDDPVAILFTSGTTGVPKGATLTSRSLLAVARLAALYPDAGEERGLCGLPLAHVMGLSTFLLSALAGTPMHWITKFDAEKVLDEIVSRRATYFVGVPAMYAMMAVVEPEEWDLSTVRLWASGADAMPPALVARFRSLGCSFRTPLGTRLLCAAFAEVYGMVELSGPAILKLTPPTPFSRAITPASFGVPIPPYRVRIAEEGGRAGKNAKAGVVGELLIRGPGVTAGYDRDAAATAQSKSADGWLHTGDLAKRNRIGLISFVTRKKDVVKHGGFSVFPAEVEAQMSAHPSIAEAAVFGVPHPTKGAEIGAAVVLKKGKRETPAALLAWCREHIASFKAPRHVFLVSSDEIPRNANRKVMRDELRDAMLSRLPGTRTSGTRSPASAGGSGGRRPAGRKR